MKRKYNDKKSNPKRANIYGLCRCRQCLYARPWHKGSIEKLKKQWKLSWKNGREFVKGLYTD